MPLLTPALISFLEVARTGSVSQAAGRLGLTQPAVTKQLQALEREVGLPILERAGRGVRLTQAGEVLRGYAQRGSALFDECRALLSEFGEGQRGKLTLGAGVTTSTLHLPLWLRRFRKAAPKIELTVRTGASRTVQEWVLGREVDAGFVTSDTAHPDLVVTRLFEEEILLVMAGDVAPRSAVTLADVALILFPAGTGFRTFLDARFAAVGQTLVARMESDSVEVIKAFVRAGLGGAYLPETAVRRELAAGKLRKVSLRGIPPLRRRTSLIRRYDRRPGAALRRFLDILGERPGR